MSYLSNPWLDRSHDGGDDCAEAASISMPVPELDLVYPTDIKDERKCLQEIRGQGKSIPMNYVLQNGMKATDFALMFVMKHHLKRKNNKENARRSVIPATPAECLDECSQIPSEK